MRTSIYLLFHVGRQWEQLSQAPDTMAIITNQNKPFLKLSFIRYFATIMSKIIDAQTDDDSTYDD